MGTKIVISSNCRTSSGRTTARLNDKRISLKEAHEIIKREKLQLISQEGYSYVFWDTYAKTKPVKEKTYYSIRVVKAKSLAQAIRKIENGEGFDEQDGLCDKVLLKDKLINILKKL